MGNNLAPNSQPLSQDEPIDTQTLDLSHKFLNKLTQNDCEELEEQHVDKAKLQHNNFRKVPKELATFKNLNFLDISYNNISSVPKEITCLPISTLSLCSNELENLEFPYEIWMESNMRTHLQSLDCTMNKLSTFPNFLSNAPAIVNIKFGFNRIQEFHTGYLSGTKKLRELLLNHNKINKIVCNTSIEITSMRKISFHDNKIQSVPDGFFNTFPKLRMIDLANNYIEHLSSDIHCSKSLREIFLEWNFLESLPNELCNLGSLQQLLLANNCLQSLPDNVGYLANLGRLDLSGNFITDDGLPDSLSNLENIAELLLPDNKLTLVPPQIHNFKNLRLLDLAFNNIREFPDTIMKELKQLCELNLSCNKLTKLPFSSMQEHEMLVRILLGGNALKQVEFDCIKNAIRIQDISVWGNQLSSFTSADIIKKFAFLSLVDVSLNPSLKKMPWDAFTELVQVQLYHIDVEGIDPTEQEAIPKELEHLLGHPSAFSKSDRFNSSWAHMCGRRPTMEDTMCVCGKLCKNRFWDLFGVFDGHAGNNTATLAAKYMPKVISSMLENGDFDINQCRISMLNAFEQVNTLIKSEGTTDGSTAVIALFVETQLIVANVGDTRAVLCRGGIAHRLSVDHKPTQSLEHQRILALGGYVTPSGRINGDLAVSRSFGDFPLQPFVSCVPSVSKIRLKLPTTKNYHKHESSWHEEHHVSEKEARKKFRTRTDSYLEIQSTDDLNDDERVVGDNSNEDEFLILACDGVWDVTSDQKAVDIVRSSPTPNIGARRLRDYAFACGSSDNISVCVIQFQS